MLRGGNIQLLNRKPDFNYALKFLSLIIYVLISQISLAQKQIEIINANTLEFDENIGQNAKRLIGEVVFKQDDVYMYCDSAYFFDNNSLDAFGSVRIKQGDSLNAYGKFLHYDGNIKRAELTDNVKLTDRNMVLTTNKLYYDTEKSIAHYVNGGKIVSKQNVLTSETGYYYTNQKSLFFKRNVVLTDPKYVVKCDTLKYNTSTKTAYVLSPTTITGKDSYIYCEDGWYNTDKELAEVKKNAYIINKDKKLRGEYIYYDGNLGFGKAKENVVMIDTTQNIEIRGDYAQFNDKTKISFVTGNALLMQDQDGRDTLYLHADTLMSYEDTLKDKKIIYAYNRVKFFKSDMQGKCDSLVYAYSDSTIKLYKSPVLWNEENQLSASYIEIENGDGSFKSLTMTESSFIVAQEDSNKFNQIKGADMKGKFSKNKLKRIYVNGNSESIYFPKNEEEKSIIGLNRSTSRDLVISMNDSSKIETISFIHEPKATLTPIKDIPLEEYYLENFKWQDAIRPKKISDIFIWN